MALLTSYLTISQPSCQVTVASAEHIKIQGASSAGNTARPLCNVIHMNLSFCTRDIWFHLIQLWCSYLFQTCLHSFWCFYNCYWRWSARILHKTCSSIAYMCQRTLRAYCKEHYALTGRTTRMVEADLSPVVLSLFSWAAPLEEELGLHVSHPSCI